MRSGWACALACRYWKLTRSVQHSRQRGRESPAAPSSENVRHLTPGALIRMDRTACTRRCTHVVDVPRSTFSTPRPETSPLPLLRAEATSNRALSKSLFPGDRQLLGGIHLLLEHIWL